jgi:hypothetical protein
VRLAVSILACAVVALAGCGSGPSEESQVRKALTDFSQAVQRRDYDRLCADLLATELLTKIRNVGLPCSVALRQGLGSVKDPKLKILKIRIRSSDLALAEVLTTASNQQASRDTFRLRKEKGKWKVGSLSGAQPPAPKPPSTGGD